jgi:hypothetical protein
MYHLELRQFPHNLNRFNLDGRELGAVVNPWVREQVVDIGERKWSPHQARLTILEGPELSLQELSLGRGWRAAERQSKDVTDRVLAEATEARDLAARAAAEAPAPAADGLLADPLALGAQLASLLGGDPTRLLAAWRDVVARAPGLSPSESLALAERQIAGPGGEVGR